MLNKATDFKEKAMLRARLQRFRSARNKALVAAGLGAAGWLFTRFASMPKATDSRLDDTSDVSTIPKPKVISKPPIQTKPTLGPVSSVPSVNPIPHSVPLVELAPGLEPQPQPIPDPVSPANLAPDSEASVQTERSESKVSLEQPIIDEKLSYQISSNDEYLSKVYVKSLTGQTSTYFNLINDRNGLSRGHSNKKIGLFLNFIKERLPLSSIQCVSLIVRCGEASFLVVSDNKLFCFSATADSSNNYFQEPVLSIMQWGHNDTLHLIGHVSCVESSEAFP